MWYWSRAFKYFSPNLPKRKSLTFGPNFSNALLLGAKSVPPVRGSERTLSRPVFASARCRVDKSPSGSFGIVEVGGGKRMTLSTAWTTPLVPNCGNHLVVFVNGFRGSEEKTYGIDSNDPAVEVYT